MNYEINVDEVILYEGVIGFSKQNKNIKFILTSKKMIFEREVGIFKKKKELIDVIPLEKIKIFNGEVQIKQNFSKLEIQTIDRNISIFFSNIIEAKKVNTKLVDMLTKTTTAKREAEKVKGAIDLIDDTLGIDTRGVIKGITENGIKGTLINGIIKKKK